MFRSLRNSVRRVPAALLLAIACTQAGCQACWSVTEGSDCGSIDMVGCADGEAALVLLAFYLVIAVPYIIAEACREW
jgi:hypothetical protein